MRLSVSPRIIKKFSRVSNLLLEFTTTVRNLMPNKNNTNLAKTPLFTRFYAKSRTVYGTVLPFSPLQQIIENISVFVAGKSDGVFLG